ncbi:TraR/DksA family transcriptional regulator [Microbacter sp. GSS18]|nr:TraR/DksA family transcriptional regulator [Microbacter sp. GSS18]
MSDTGGPSAARILADHRASAERRHAQLEDEIAELRRERAAESADDEHDPEGDTLSAEWSRLEGLRTAAAAELSDIQQAQERLRAGAYGVCVDCGRAIPDARLEVRPTAQRCVECAARAGG